MALRSRPALGLSVPTRWYAGHKAQELSRLLLSAVLHDFIVSGNIFLEEIVRTLAGLVEAVKASRRFVDRACART